MESAFNDGYQRIDPIMEIGITEDNVDTSKAIKISILNISDRPKEFNEKSFRSR